MDIANELKFTWSVLVNLSPIIGSVAPVVALYYAKQKYKWDNRKEINMFEVEIFKEIYSRFLITDLPNAKKMLHYNGNEIEGVDEVNDVLNDLRRSSSYFEMADVKFYQQIKTRQQNLEDKLTSINNTDVSDEKNEEFRYMIDSEIREIIKLISNKYQSYYKF